MNVLNLGCRDQGFRVMPVCVALEVLSSWGEFC